MNEVSVSKVVGSNEVFVGRGNQDSWLKVEQDKIGSYCKLLHNFDAYLIFIQKMSFCISFKKDISINLKIELMKFDYW